MRTATGVFLVPSGTTTDYTAWTYSNPTISLDILTQDQACNVQVDWLDIGGAVLYTLNGNFCFAEYNKQFFYELIQDQGLQPGVRQDVTYDSNSALLWTNIVGAINAVEFGNDIAAGQNCLNRATALRLTEAFSF